MLLNQIQKYIYLLFLKIKKNIYPQVKFTNKNINI